MLSCVLILPENQVFINNPVGQAVSFGADYVDNFNMVYSENKIEVVNFPDVADS